MRIGIISDTHDNIENIKKAIDVFNTENVDVVYHAGDWCSPFVLHLFAKLNCPVKGVFGNNDADKFKHMKHKPDNVTFHDTFLEDEVDGKTVCLLHGDPHEMVKGIIQSKRYDIVMHGHNHMAEIDEIEGVLVINPGNLIGPFSDMTKNWTAPSVILYDSQQHEAWHVALD